MQGYILRKTVMAFLNLEHLVQLTLMHITKCVIITRIAADLIRVPHTPPTESIRDILLK